MSFTLRPLSDINTLINSADYAALPFSRKYQLAGLAESAAFELDLVIPVLIAQAASPLEEQFVRALVIVTALGDPSSTATGSYLLIPMIFQGTLANNQIFGWFTTPASLNVTAMQISLQQPDPDAVVSVVLVDAYGATLADSNWPVITAGDSYHDVILNNPLSMFSGTLVRAMTTNYTPGSNGPIGSGLTCNLVARLL